MIGLLVIQAIRLAGCAKVIAIDLEDSKLEIAKTLGADYTLKSKQVRCGGRSCQADRRQRGRCCTRSGRISATVQSAIQCVRRGGSITLVGNLSPEVKLPLQAVVTRELSIYGSCASNGEYPECIELMRRGVQSERAVDHRHGSLGRWSEVV